MRDSDVVVFIDANAHHEALSVMRRMNNRRVSFMEPKDRFLNAARARNWKVAYDECNGLNMVDMLDCLQEIGPDLLRDMRAQMATYDVWGGPNMPRIRFAMDVVELRTVPAAPGGLPDDQVLNARDFLARAAVASNIRTSIVTLARSFVATAHYLWGTAGNQPGIPNGNRGGGKLRAAEMRRPGLDPGEANRDKVLAIGTAWSDPPQAYSTCAGRSKRYSSEGPDLTAFLSACADEVRRGNSDQTTWRGAGSQNRLFPRKYYFKDKLQDLVWGENCANTRHFDCVGLVNYCYARHWRGGDFGIDLKEFRDSKYGTQPVGKHAERMDADILIKPDNTHIGMLYHKGENWFVVQAVDTTWGLSDAAPFNPDDWDRFRMQGRLLTGLRP